MALAIDASSPAVATNGSTTVTTVTTTSFTPPASSLLVVLWAGDSDSGVTPGAASITDNLGTHLTYTQQQFERFANTVSVNGQAAIWTAPVTSSAAMTVTVTTGVVASFKESSVKVMVLTDTSQPTVGTSSKGGQSAGTAVPMAYTATQTGSWGFSVISDWDAKGNETAGTGTTLIATGNSGTGISFGFFRRTTADGTNGVTTTLNGTLPVASTNVQWAAVEIKAAAAAANPAITFTPRRRRVGLPPVRRAESAQAVPAQVVVTPPAYAQRVTRVRRFLPALRRQAVDQVVPAQAAPVAPAYAPQAPRPRRLGRNRGRAALWWPVAAQQTAPGPTARRRLQSPTRRTPRRAAAPVPAQAAATPAPLWVPAVARGLRLVARTVRRGGADTPVPAQQTAPVNPAITNMTFGRLRSVGRTVRRGQVRNHIPGQAAPLVHSAFGRLRLTARLVRRGQVKAPIPAQQAAPTNPAITNRIFGRLRLTGRLVRRGQADYPVPAQQAAPTNPPITQTVFGRLRQVGRVNRRTVTVKPVQAQAAAPAPTWVPGMAARRRPVTRVPAHHSAAPIPAAETVRPRLGRRRPSLFRRGVSRIRQFISPPPGVVQGALVVSDSAGTVTPGRTSTTVAGGVYSSGDGVTGARPSTAAVTPEVDGGAATHKYDSQSDTL